jgi:hypothetical protein
VQAAIGLLQVEEIKIRRGPQLAIKAEIPAMIGAKEAIRLSTVCRHKPRPAMRAYIMEGA